MNSKQSTLSKDLITPVMPISKHALKIMQVQQILPTLVNAFSLVNDFKVLSATRNSVNTSVDAVENQDWNIERRGNERNTFLNEENNEINMQDASAAAMYARTSVVQTSSLAPALATVLAHSPAPATVAPTTRPPSESKSLSRGYSSSNRILIQLVTQSVEYTLFKRRKCRHKWWKAQYSTSNCWCKLGLRKCLLDPRIKKLRISFCAIIFNFCQRSPRFQAMNASLIHISLLMPVK